MIHAQRANTRGIAVLAAARARRTIPADAISDALDTYGFVKARLGGRVFVSNGRASAHAALPPCRA